MSENEPGKPQKGWGWLQWGVAVGWCFLFFYAMSYYFVEGAAGSVVALRLFGGGVRWGVTLKGRPNRRTPRCGWGGGI